MRVVGCRVQLQEAEAKIVRGSRSWTVVAVDSQSVDWKAAKNMSMASGLVRKTGQEKDIWVWAFRNVND